jgi:hypothetical protein
MVQEAQSPSAFVMLAEWMGSLLLKTRKDTYLYGQAQAQFEEYSLHKDSNPSKGFP